MLADQAREHADTYDDIGTPIWLNQYNKFFAELIVSECAQIAYWVSPSNESASAVSQAIKEHFGV